MEGATSMRGFVLALEVDYDRGLVTRTTIPLFCHRDLAVAFRRFDLCILHSSHFVVTVAAMGSCLPHCPSSDFFARCIASVVNQSVFRATKCDEPDNIVEI